jgi:hypothetical protein
VKNLKKNNNMNERKRNDECSNGEILLHLGI